MEWRHGMAVVLALVFAGCGGELADRRGALEHVLADERTAHLGTDAALIARHLADSLVSVADGRITVQTREEVRDAFSAYFDGAIYETWDDVEPPRISLSPAGRLAVVHRHVEAERLEPAAGSTQRRAFESAWTASYRWTDDGWKMTSVTSTFVPTRSMAVLIVEGARRRVGFASLPSDSVLRTVADVTGPAGGFRVAVHSRASGDARIDFGQGASMGAYRGGGWVSSPAGAVDSLSRSELAFLRGHEVHLTLLAPATRLSNLRYAGRTVAGTDSLLRVEGDDAAGGTVTLLYSLADTLPVGFTTPDHLRGGGEVSVSTRGWGEPGDRGLATEAVFRQGAETFRYRYSESSWVPADASTFLEPGAFALEGG